MAKYFTSPIVYMGSKRRLMESLMDYFPREINHFIDVFGGSGTVALNAPSRTVQLNEFDKNVVQLYHYLIDTPHFQIEEDVDTIIDTYGVDGELMPSGYNQLRDDFNQNKENTALLHVLMRYSFQNMMRFNADGDFTTSYGGRGVNKPNQDYYTRIYTFAEILYQKQVQITNLDFRDVDYSVLTSDDFVYFDPPYILTNAVYNQRNNGWDESDEADLYKLIKGLADRGVSFGLSNVETYRGQCNPLLQEFMKDYTVYRPEIKYHARIGSSPHEERTEGQGEVYVTNFTHEC